MKLPTIAIAAATLALPAAAGAQLFVNDPVFQTGPIERQRPDGRHCAGRARRQPNIAPR